MVMFLVMAATIHSYLAQARGLALFPRRQRTLLRMFLYFYLIFVANFLVSWLRPDSDPRFVRTFGVNHFVISNWSILLLPPLVCLALQLRIPLSLAFLVQSMFARENLVAKMLPGAVVNYLLSLSLSLALGGLLRRRWERNSAGDSGGSLWSLAFQLSRGLLWYNLAGAFMPNFVAFLPRGPITPDIGLFLLLALAVLFFSIRSVTGRSRDCRESEMGREMRLSLAFDLAYSAALLIIGRMGAWLLVITPWISAGLSSGMELVFGTYGGKSRARVLGEKIFGDFCALSLGAGVASLFVTFVRI
jgi:hypothetical protein